MLDDCGANNPAGLDPQVVATLKAGGAASGARMLYPYDGTVFPRGMIAPTLMWDGAPGDVVYVHISAPFFDYQGCLRVTGTQQLQLPQAVWEQAGDQTTGPQGPFTIELTVSNGGVAAGPIQTEIVIAQATLKGSIFYNSYISMLSTTGSVFRIPPGGNAEVFIGGGASCVGCHSVSANGSRLVASDDLSYALTPMTAPNPPMNATAPNASFAGLAPGGSVYINSAVPANGIHPLVPAFGDTPSVLYDTDTGTAIGDSGIATAAVMPTFAPNGREVVFNDAGMSPGNTLAVMDYDPAARKFSNQRMIYQDAEGKYAGWPFFLPDSHAVIFARGDSGDFSGGGIGVSSIFGGVGPASDLYILDLQSGKATILALAMGMNSPQDQTSYTPFGATDLHQHYYPTVSPVAAGGYFWVFFDTIRNYGNLGAPRQLWGSAITISPDGHYEGDASHPAFYVTGQEFGTGNHRAFTALDPCKEDGDSCDTGIDCCSGFCTDGMCGLPPPPPPGEDPPPPRCSATDEACQTTADCCNPADICINGFCGQIIVL